MPARQFEMTSSTDSAPHGDQAFLAGLDAAVMVAQYGRGQILAQRFDLPGLLSFAQLAKRGRRTNLHAVEFAQDVEDVFGCFHTAV